MTIYKTRDAAVERLTRIKAARQQAYDGMQGIDDLISLEKEYKKNLALHLIGELPKFNPSKEFDAIEMMRKKRSIDMQAIEALDVLNEEATGTLAGLRARIKADEQSYETFERAVRAGLDYSGELMQAAEKRGMSRARDDAKKSGDSRYSNLTGLRRNISALTDIAAELGRAADVADLIKQAGPVINLLVEPQGT